MDGSRARIVPGQQADINMSLARILAEELRVNLVEAEQSIAFARLEQDLGALNVARQTLQNGLKLLDQYIDSGELLKADQELQNQTVTIGALLLDVAHRSEAATKLHDAKLEVDYKVLKRPILVDSERLCMLLENLVSAFMRLPLKRLVLGAHITKSGARIGVFSEDLATGTIVDKAITLAGSASQATQFNIAGAAHLMIADWLGKRMAYSISPSRHKGMRGVAITVPWSEQLILL